MHIVRVIQSYSVPLFCSLLPTIYWPLQAILDAAGICLARIWPLQGRVQVHASISYDVAEGFKALDVKSRSGRLLEWFLDVQHLSRAWK